MKNSHKSKYTFTNAEHYPQKNQKKTPPSHTHTKQKKQKTQDPGAYGQLGLSDLFEMREECLREFGFSDVYRLDKDTENALALQV
jgi:type II pantothenate kinase